MLSSLPFMPPPLIRITGPAGVPYELGQPMLLFADRLFLGRLDPVQLSGDGLAVCFGSFLPSSIAQNEPRNLGALLFMEACDHIIRHHPRIQLVRFASSRPMAGIKEPAQQAAARVATAQLIGATDVQVTRAPSGLLVVSGNWLYNDGNLKALRLQLDAQRAIFRKVGIGTSTGWRVWLSHLQQLRIRSSRVM